MGNREPNRPLARTSIVIALVWSAVARGARGFLVRVEADVSGGLPRMSVVGLAAGAVREAKERIVAAVRNSGRAFPDGRVTVNLAPAELPKDGSQLDLPMALGVLASSGQLPAAAWSSACLVLGELGLDGSVLPGAGVLVLAGAARSHGLRYAVVPAANAEEAELAGLVPIPVRTLAEAAVLLSGPEPGACLSGPRGEACSPEGEPDLADVRGQLLARRALEVAAAGGHNLLLVGPPGTGKSMLAARLPGLMPRLEPEESLEVTTLHAAAGLLRRGAGLMTRRPFRAPHSSAKPAALLGGGPNARPGELVLAHRGVLFLDELPEFPRDSLESLRQPLEDRVVRLARAKGFAEFPADCAVVGAMNPCQCGRAGLLKNPCRCPESAVTRYRARLSGPLLDRFDLRVELAPIPFSDWLGRAGAAAESSSAVRERVLAARSAAGRRAGVLNSRLGPAEVRRHCGLDRAGWNLIASVVEREQLSARGIDRVLRVARTLADLEGARDIARAHVGEALQYRGDGTSGRKPAI
ncbi:MAG: YifB family Mg chelatase-like AAA ATPase [Elusimicrobia bacterium]|nr:YifB family Mg chelatase-like AAA ATPase [Elusimicrobiota bacterium]